MATHRVSSAPDDGTPTSPGGPTPAHRRWPLFLVPAAVVGAVFAFWLWAANAETRELRSLPDQQRLTLFQRLLDDLRNVCDPAPPRSLRDFCRRQAELALKFRECDGNPACQELARRHLSQPRR
jgi:hypothetical protein